MINFFCVPLILKKHRIQFKVKCLKAKKKMTQQKIFCNKKINHSNKTATKTAAKKTATKTAAKKTATKTAAKKTATKTAAKKTATKTAAKKTATKTAAKKTATKTAAKQQLRLLLRRQLKKQKLNLTKKKLKFLMMDLIGQNLRKEYRLSVKNKLMSLINSLMKILLIHIPKV